MNRINISIIITILAAVFAFGCGEMKDNSTSEDKTSIFPKGEKGPAENFTGTAWHYPLVAPDSVFTTATGNVKFEPGARTNWHLHGGGQILIVTAGVGYHQLKGEPIEVIRKGDVVKCPPDIDHWHGASKDSSMTHIYIVPNIERGIVEWKDPVTDEEYTNL